MLILKSKISGNGFGYVKLRIESDEDNWELYNLILSGDSIKSITQRKTYKEHTSGKVTAKIHKTLITIIVKSVEYEGVDSIRISGFNAVDNEYVKMGQHHTIELRKGSEFILYKRNWDWLMRNRLSECTKKKIGTGEDILILLIGNGTSNMFIVSPQRTSKLFSITQNIPRTNVGNAHKESKKKFFDNITKNLLSHINVDDVDNIILGGPGFYKEDYLKHLTQVSSVDNKSISYLINRKKHIFMLAKTSSVYQSSIDEIILNHDFYEKLKDTKAYVQTKLLERFQYYLSMNSNNVCYGIKHIEIALENNAVETLLLSDRLLRTDNFSLRKKISQITETNNNMGGKISIFSSTHNSGKALDNLTGIAAILRFSLEFELSDIDDGTCNFNEQDIGIEYYTKVENDLDNFNSNAEDFRIDGDFLTRVCEETENLD
ncbi:pelota Dom34 pelota like RNA binding domain [Cryptosporidium bovis]|uniref:pelota Dom34 pelota like RNA binding domain n=1 Tax=Cryptosporidium bovis TaxID=310047 RepID=UPI00351A6BF9|nr:pelota Dom34 pelota like RNA binding domain [Cryptosporidium bovis]